MKHGANKFVFQIDFCVRVAFSHNISTDWRTAEVNAQHHLISLIRTIYFNVLIIIINDSNIQDTTI